MRKILRTEAEMYAQNWKDWASNQLEFAFFDSISAGSPLFFSGKALSANFDIPLILQHVPNAPEKLFIHMGCEVSFTNNINRVNFAPILDCMITEGNHIYFAIDLKNPSMPGEYGDWFTDPRDSNIPNVPQQNEIGAMSILGITDQQLIEDILGNNRKIPTEDASQMMDNWLTIPENQIRDKFYNGNQEVLEFCRFTDANSPDEDDPKLIWDEIMVNPSGKLFQFNMGIDHSTSPYKFSPVLNVKDATSNVLSGLFFNFCTPCPDNCGEGDKYRLGLPTN